MGFLGGNNSIVAGDKPPVQIEPQFKQPSALANTIGRVGDALAMAGGRQGVYAPYRQDQDARNAFGQLITNPEDANAFALLAQANPGLALQFRNSQIAAQKAGTGDPTNTEKVFNFLSRTLGPQGAKQYLQSVALGPPVAVDSYDNQGNQTREFKTRGEVYGGGQQGSGSAAAPDWVSQFSPEELKVMQGEAQRRLGAKNATANVPTGSPLSGAAQVKTAADYDKLPVGTSYYDPQGNLRTKGKK